MPLNEWHLLVQIVLIDERDEQAKVLLTPRSDGRWGLPGGVVKRPPIHATAIALLRAQTGVRATPDLLSSMGTFETSTPDGAPVLVLLFQGPVPPDTVRLREDIHWVDTLTFDVPADDMDPWVITLTHFHHHARNPDLSTALPGPIALPE